jgi:DNA-binding MarR family transcriptional regulator
MWEKSRLSHHLRRMTERGLVTIEQCPTDSRGTVVVLSDAGWDAITTAAPGHVRLVREIFIDRLSPEQLVVLGEIAERFTSGLVGQPSEEECGREG